MASRVDGDVSIDIDVLEDRTVVAVRGTRDAALVVESDGEEQIYLPPEGFDEDPDLARAPADSPYEGSPPADSPYEGLGRSGSPYESSDAGGSAGGDATGRGSSRPILGVQETADGFRVVHPAPVQDVRLLR